MCRQRALKALRRRPRFGCLLVVCRGNICRSPFAAALLRPALSRSRVRVDSVGLTAPGRPSPPEAVAAAARPGGGLSGHRAQLLAAENVRAGDPLVVIDLTQPHPIC